MDFSATGMCISRSRLEDAMLRSPVCILGWYTDGDGCGTFGPAGARPMDYNQNEVLRSAGHEIGLHSNMRILSP